MLTINAEMANQAWRLAFTDLYKNGSKTDNNKYFRDEPALIIVNKPSLDKSDPFFPMDQKNIEAINKYIWSGKAGINISHEWTKLYHNRMFDNPNSQIKYLIKNLGKIDANSPVPITIMSLWDKNIDQKSRISPCVLVVWARIKNAKLEMHVHSHSSDAYKKLLMNLQEFISVQHYIARRKSVNIGAYYHFIDSLHIHLADFVNAKELYSKLNTNFKLHAK